MGVPVGYRILLILALLRAYRANVLPGHVVVHAGFYVIADCYAHGRNLSRCLLDGGDATIASRAHAGHKHKRSNRQSVEPSLNCPFHPGISDHLVKLAPASVEALGAGMGGPALSQSLAPTVSGDGFIGINLELFDQTAEFGGGFNQLLRRILLIAGAARRAFGRLRHA